MEDRLRPVSRLLDRVRFVLCRPRNPVNIGAVARALQCAGVGQWAIVDPQTLDWDSARIVAVHAEAMLEKVKICKTLKEAVEGCALTIGTTGMHRPERTPLSPKEAAAAAFEIEGEVAFVFGDERTGLRIAELDLLDRLANIPSTPDQPSWNLAQSAAVFSYELRMAELAARPVTPRPLGRRADAGQLAYLDRTLLGSLDKLGWTKVRRRLFKTLDRSALTVREAHLWTATLLALGRALPEREKVVRRPTTRRRRGG